MPSRLAERLAAREAAIIQAVIAQTSPEGTASSSSAASLATENTIFHHASPSSASTAPHIGTSRVDTDPSGAIDVQDVAVDTTITVAESNVMNEIGETAALALTVQPSAKAVNMEAVMPSLASVPAALTASDLVHAADAERGPSDAPRNMLSPLPTLSSESSSANAKPSTDTEPQIGNNVMSTPESMSSAEHAPTKEVQERRARPQRAAAAKAVGKYVQGIDIDINIMKEGAQSHLPVQTPPKTPVKRKRYLGSGATNASALGSMDAEVYSDYHKPGKPAQKKQKSGTSGS